MHRKLKERAMAMALAVVMTVSNIPMNSFAMEYEPAMEEQTDMNAEQYAEEPTAQDEYAQDDYQEPAQDEYYQEPAQDDSAQEPEQDDYTEPAQDEYTEPAQDEYTEPAQDEQASADEYADEQASAAEEMVDEFEEEDGIQEEEVEGSNDETVDSEYDIPFEDLIFDEDIVDDETMELLMAGEDSITFSDDIADFIDLPSGDSHINITIKDAQGNDTTPYGNPGDSFTLELKCTESEALQFKMADNFTDNPITLHDMTYDLPDGVDWSVITPLTVTYNFHDPKTDTNYTLQGTISLSQTEGKATVSWDVDPSNPADIEKLKTASEISEMSFQFTVHGKINEDEDVIPFNDDIVFYVDNTSKMEIQKQFAPAALKDIIDADPNLQRDTIFTVTVQQATPVPAGQQGDYVRDPATGHIVYHSEDITFSYYDILHSDDLKYLISGLEDGTYTVKEISVPEVYGYTYSKANAKVDDTSGSDVTVEPSAEHPVTASVPLGKSDTKSISYTNTYTQDKGSIVVTKDITGDLDPADMTTGDKQAIRFYVYKAGTTTPVIAQFNYSQFTNGQYTVGNLPLGSYDVVESVTTDVGGYTRTTTYTVGTTTTSDKATTSVDSDGDVAEVTVTNDYEQHYGQLKLVKIVDKTGAPGLTDSDIDGITFTLKDPSGAVVNVVKTSSGEYHYVKKVGTTYVSTVDQTVYAATDLVASFTYADMTNGELLIKGLPCVKYTLYESNMKFTGYARTTYKYVDGAVGSTVTDTNNPQASTTVVENNNNKSVGFKNVYTIAGKLKVTKSVSGITLTNDQKKAITFTLFRKGVNGQPDTQIGNPIRYYDFTSGAYTWSNLEFGEYYVVENAGSVANYDIVTTFKVGSGTTQTGTTSTNATVDNASMSTPPVIAFTNTYSHYKGKLKVKKTVNGQGMTEEEKKDIKFTVTGPNCNFNVTYGELVAAGNGGTITKGNYTLKVEKSGDSYTFTVEGSDGSPVLDTGNYTVTESNAAIEGY